MPYDSEGNFTRLHCWEEDRVNNIDIVSDRHDEEDNNFAEGLNHAFLKDGRVPMNGNLNVNNFQIKNVANATSSGDAVNKAQLNAVSSQVETLDNSAVHKTGEETITGTKTFQENALIGKSTVIDTNVTPTSNQYSNYLKFKDKNGIENGSLGSVKYANGDVGARLCSFRNINGTEKSAQLSLNISSSGSDSVSATSGIIKSIIKWMMPDYSSGSSISSGYVTTKSGFLKIKTEGNYRTSWLKINGVDVFFSNWPATYGCPDNTFIPVAENSTVTYEGTISVTFFKCIGA